MVEVGPLSTRTLGIAVVAVAAGVAGYLLVVGGSSGPGDVVDDPADAYTDADERFRVSTDSSSSRTHRFEVPSGTAVVTVARSLQFPRDGTWRLFDPDGDRHGRVGPGVEGSFLDEPSGANVVHRPQAGTWRMTVDCESGCDYTLGVYLRDALSRPTGSLEDDVRDADVRVHVSHDRSVSRQEGFEVPEGVDALELGFSFYAADGGTFRIEDPSGEQVTRWSWDAEWLDRSTRYVLADEPPAGTWTVAYNCAAGCEGAWGLRLR